MLKSILFLSVHVYMIHQHLEAALPDPCLIITLLLKIPFENSWLLSELNTVTFWRNHFHIYSIRHMHIQNVRNCCLLDIIHGCHLYRTISMIETIKNLYVKQLRIRIYKLTTCDKDDTITECISQRKEC